jgi:hypothetical protein
VIDGMSRVILSTAVSGITSSRDQSYAFTSMIFGGMRSRDTDATASLSAGLVRARYLS